MGVPTSEVGYTSTMPRREDHEVHKRHAVALEGGTLASGSTNHGDFLNYLRNYEVLKRGLPHVVSWMIG